MKHAASAAAVVFALLAGCKGPEEPPAATPATISPPVQPAETAAPSASSPSGATTTVPVASAPHAEASLPPPKPTTIALARTNDAQLDAMLAEADKAFEAGDLAAALAGYEAAKKASPKRAGPIVGAARVKITKASPTLGFAAAEKNVDVIAASKDLKRAADMEPAYGPAHVEQGRALLLLGDAPQAEAALRKGTKLVPEEPEAHSALGVALLATGKTEEALVELTKAKDLDPGSAARRGNLGTVLFMRGRVKRRDQGVRGPGEARPRRCPRALRSRNRAPRRERLLARGPRAPARDRARSEARHVPLEPGLRPAAPGQGPGRDRRVPRGDSPRPEARERVDQPGHRPLARPQDARGGTSGAEDRGSDRPERSAREGEPRGARRAREAERDDGSRRQAGRRAETEELIAPHGSITTLKSRRADRRARLDRDARSGGSHLGEHASERWSTMRRVRVVAKRRDRDTPQWRLVARRSRARRSMCSARRNSPVDPPSISALFMCTYRTLPGTSRVMREGM